MSKPIQFKPGDILTADDINRYLVERTDEAQARFNEQILAIKAQIEQKLALIDAALDKFEIYSKGGRPTYDYEAI